MSRQSIQAGKAVIIVDVVDRATQSFKKLQSGIMNASRGLRDISTNAAGLSLLTGVPIAKGLGNYAKFTDSLQNIEAKLGNFGLASMKVRLNSIELRKEIIQLGRDTAYTSIEVADAAAAMAQGGFAGDEIKSSLKAVVDLGRGTKIALDDAARLSVTLATTFKLFKEGAGLANAAAMTSIADQLTKAARLSVAEIQDLGASLVYVSQKASDLGVTVPEVLALLNQLAQAGIRGSVAGTSLNTAFGNLTNNLEKIKTQFPNFNIIFKKDGGVDAIETFGRLGQLMKNMGKVAKTQFLQDIFNLRGERAASALEDIDAMRKGLRQIRDSAGEAAMSAQTMQAGFGGALERISGAIDAVVNKIGIKFDKQLKGTAEIIALMIDRLGNLSVKHTALLGVIILSPAIFAATATAALTMSFVLARLSTVVGLLIKGFKGLKSVGGIMLGGAKSLVSPIAAMAKSRSIKAAAIKKTSEKIGKLQLALDLSYTKASARKVGAAEAVAKIAAGKKQEQLIAAVSARNKLQSGGIGGILSRGKAAGQAIINKANLVDQTVAEKSFYAKRQATYSKHAAFMLKKQQYYETMGKIIQRRGVGDPRSEFATAAKARASKAASLAKAANASKLMKGASISKALFSGMKLPSMGRAITGIAQLTFAFGRLSAGLARFIFSWNFVGLALNALLLFGDKIPAVNKAFKDLGSGISAAFYQISRIGTYAAPALQLFSLAIEAFANGNTAIGVRALAAAFTGVVSIIQNQLTAAWAAFSMKVADLWLNITKIGTAIFSVFSTLFKGLGEIFGNAFEGVSDRVSGLFGGKGESAFMIGIAIVALSLNNFITNFSATVINLQDWGGQFADDIKNIISGKELLKSTVNTVFGSKSQLAVGMYGKRKEIPINPRLGELENERLKREIEILNAIKKTPEGQESDQAYNRRIAEKAGWSSRNKDSAIADKFNQRIREDFNAKLVAAGKKPEPRLAGKDPNQEAVTGANNDSQGTSNVMENMLERLNAELALIYATQAAAVQAAAGKKPFMANTEQDMAGPNAAQKFISKLEVLVGSVGETRARFKVTSEKTMVDIAKEQLQETKLLRQDVKTAGMM